MSTISTSNNATDAYDESRNHFRQDALVISLVGLAHGISHFFHMILAPLFPWLKPVFGLSYSELGLLMSAFFVVSGIGQALAGFVVDRVGARNVLFFGLCCLGLSAVVLALAPNYPVLLLGAMLAGLGNSVFHPADYTILNQSVSHQRMSHAFSVHGVSGNLGWAAAPVFLVTLANLFDWRVALLCAAALPILVLVILFVYRDLFHPALAQQTKAATAPVNQQNQANPAKQEAVNKDSHESAFDFLSMPSIWMCFSFFLMIALGLGGIQSFSPSALREIYGISLPEATVAYTAYMLTSAGGMIWGGFIAAKTSAHDKTISLAFSFSACMALLLASGLPAPVWSIALMGAIGLGAGIAGPSRDLLIRAAAPKNATGRVFGVVYSGLDTGLAIAPALFGAVMDAHQPKLVFVLVGVFQMLAIFTAQGVGVKMRAKMES